MERTRDPMQVDEPQEFDSSQDLLDSSGEPAPSQMRPEGMPLRDVVSEYDIIPSPDMEKKPVMRDEEGDQSLYEIQCPRVNCREKIIICLDMSSEMDKMIFRSRAGDKQCPLKLVRSALELFLHTKSAMDAQHQFALLVLYETPTWVRDFTSKPVDILRALDDLQDTMSCEAFDISTLFDMIQEKVALPLVTGDPTILPPPYVVRLLMLYGRSHCTIDSSRREAQRCLESSPFFFVDAFYIHEPPSEENKCEEIFDQLCELDHRGLSYILEAAQNPTKVFNCLAQLLAHPLQRPLQKSTAYTIAEPPGMDPVP